MECIGLESNGTVKGVDRTGWDWNGQESNGAVSGTIEGYYRFLSQYPIESIEKALVTHIETSDAFPTVHQLKELLSNEAPIETA